MGYLATRTRATEISSVEYVIGNSEKYPAVHYVDSNDNDDQFLIICPKMILDFGEQIEFKIKVLKWIPKLNQWLISPYNQYFNVGRMVVDNSTYVDPNTGIPLNPQPQDDPNFPKDDPNTINNEYEDALSQLSGEYDFWSFILGGTIENAIQSGIINKFRI